VTGNVAGWLLSFLREDRTAFTVVEAEPALEINSDQYYADIHAGLPSGLEGGTYVFTVEGLRDEHYELIAQGLPWSPAAVRLYLYWQDDPGYLHNLAGLGTGARTTSSAFVDGPVAELRIVSVARKAGTRTYETTITARERIFDVLNVRHLPKAANDKALPKSIAASIDYVLRPRLLDGFKQPAYEVHPFDEPPAEKRKPRSFEAGRSLLEHVRTLAGDIEEQTQLHGRGMLLIRQGRLHIGPRPLPLTGGAGSTVPLTLQSGLLEVLVTGSRVIDPYFDFSSLPDAVPAERRQWRATLKGRPDIRPGDLVSFEPSPEDLAAGGDSPGGLDVAGSLGAAAGAGGLVGGQSATVTVYVESVDHRLSRTSAFVTTLTGVETTPDRSGGWDRWSEHPAHRKSKPAQTAAASTPDRDSARAVADYVQRSIDQIRLPEVGEVRGVQVQESEGEPAQTLTVWQGLVTSTDDPDTDPEQARRLDIARPSAAPMDGVPYLTPFAFGKCGLILPRYPGTRVLVAHRNGQASEPIDIGALWRTGDQPTEAEVGDWWLSLPASIPSDKAARTEIDDSTVPQAYTHDVTNDLIDSNGHRVIETRTVSIRVGDEQLRQAGERPSDIEPSTIFEVSVRQNGKGASIKINTEGGISIHCDGDLNLDAPNGTITMKARNVNVVVKNNMDVSQG
jgi:hypothetical protein